MNPEHAFPPVADVLPHAGRMVLLTRIVDHAEESTTCRVDAGPDAPFREPSGLVPAYVGVEYLAQCIAAHAGLRARARGEPVKPGLLLGSRRIDFRTDGFRAGQALLVSATRVWGERQMAVFAGVLRDEATGMALVEGTLSVVLADPLDAARKAASR